MEGEGDKSKSVATAVEEAANPDPDPNPNPNPNPNPIRGREGREGREGSERSEGELREEQVQSAVRFLSHPRVRGSPVVYRRSFLEKKGLTPREIDEAFRRVPVSNLI
jgi:Pex14 N-terminal domain